MFHPMLHMRGPLGVVADAIARGIDRLIEPKPDPTLQFVTGALPLVPALLQALKPSTPVDLDGPKVKQVRREFAAEEARLQAVFAESRARLVADFGPRFDQARAADELEYDADEDAESASAGIA
jgi:hypothetical protein